MFLSQGAALKSACTAIALLAWSLMLVPPANGQTYFRLRTDHHRTAKTCGRFVHKKRHRRVVCTHRCKTGFKRVRKTYRRKGRLRGKAVCIKRRSAPVPHHAENTNTTRAAVIDHGEQKEIRLRAHLDPTYTRNPLDPFEVTYAYSASAATEGPGGSEEPATLPYGVLQLFNDGVLIPACSINVGGEVTGGNCVMDYYNNGGLGKHTLTTVYISGESSASITEVEDIEPLPGSITIDRYEYVPDEEKAGEEFVGHFVITETATPFVESAFFYLSIETGISGQVETEAEGGTFPGTSIYWTPTGEWPPTGLRGWGGVESRTFTPKVIVSCSEPDPYVTIEPEDFHLPWWHFPTPVAGSRPPNLRVSEFGDGSHPLTATRHATSGYTGSGTSANINFEPC